MEADYKKLDNPAWHALTETHKQFGIEYPNIKFYDPDYCAFGGLDTTADIGSGISQYAALTNEFFVIGHKPELPKGHIIKKELVCLQMVSETQINIDVIEEITLLGAKDDKAIFDLVMLVQPGYFKRKTVLLGNYYGIYKNGQLVSLAGERMKMKGFTEVSAIVTHPEHSGQGYAKQLVGYLVNSILLQKNIPFLHVADTNVLAIRLYEKLGFKTRRKMSFWNIIEEHNK